jgi:predicted transcriptional regulator
MAESTVRELLAPAIILDSARTVAEALRQLEQAGVTFCVIQDEQGRLAGLVTAEELRKADPQARLDSLLTAVPSPISIDPDVRIEHAVRVLAKDLVLQPRLQGVIVREQGQVRGVLPRQELVERASRLVTRSIVDRMEGAPVDILYFECPIDGERQLVAYYDPDNPPTCSQGHRMRPVED